MKTTLILFLCITCSPGCVRILDQTWSSDTLITNDLMIGDWVSDLRSHQYAITQEGNIYCLKHYDSIQGSAELYDLHLFSVDGKDYLDVSKKLSREEELQGLLASHLLLQINIVDNDTCHLFMIDVSKCGELINDNALQYANTNRGLVITSSAKEIQAVLKNYGDKLFMSRPVIFRRDVGANNPKQR